MSLPAIKKREIKEVLNFWPKLRNRAVSQLPTGFMFWEFHYAWNAKMAHGKQTVRDQFVGCERKDMKIGGWGSKDPLTGKVVIEVFDRWSRITSRRRYYLTKKVTVPARLADDYARRRREAMNRSFREFQFSWEIQKLEARMKDQRFYRGALRQLVIRRDRATCQSCLKTKEMMKDVGLRLEVDHKTPWPIGRTTFENGQVLCSQCNLEKYHLESLLGRAGQPVSHHMN